MTGCLLTLLFLSIGVVLAPILVTTLVTRRFSMLRIWSQRKTRYSDNREHSQSSVIPPSCLHRTKRKPGFSMISGSVPPGATSFRCGCYFKGAFSSPFWCEVQEVNTQFMRNAGPPEIHSKSCFVCNSRSSRRNMVLFRVGSFFHVFVFPIVFRFAQCCVGAYSVTQLVSR